jgi:hypothetical protein
VDSDEKNFDEGKSTGTVTTESNQDIQSAKSSAALDIQKEAQEGTNQSAEDHIMASDQEKLDEELSIVVLAQDDNIQPGRKSACCDEIER